LKDHPEIPERESTEENIPVSDQKSSARELASIEGDSSSTGAEILNTDNGKKDDRDDPKKPEEGLWVGWNDNGDKVYIKSSQLNRHMAVLGSTGSGKTVLCKAIVESAIIDEIPVIAVDPQGDLVRLGLMGERSVLEEKNIPVELAKEYKNKVGLTIFTPGTHDGIKIVLDPVNSFPKPEDKDKLSENQVLKLLAAISANLVSLFTISSKQKRSYIEHIIYKSLELAYENKDDIVSLKALYGYLKADKVQNKLNESVSASIMKSYPDMLAELELIIEGPTGTLFRDGVPLNLDLLLEKKNGRTPLNVFYLNTLDDKNLKQFFLAYLGNELYSYMLRKGKINALFFIDEVKIFLPPGTQKTQSKSILLSLLEQGRKYGLKMMMATQSPGKIDYQAFSQCNTRAYGILSTKQDLDKVKDSVPDNIKDNLPKLASGAFYLQDPRNNFDRLNVRWLYTDHGEPIPAQNLKELMQEEIIEYYKRYLDETSGEESKAETSATMTESTITDDMMPELPDMLGKESDGEQEKKSVPPKKKGKSKQFPVINPIPMNANSFRDLLKLVNILIMHKKGGICILDKSTGYSDQDPQLISGFLHALSTWMKEIGPDEREYGQRMRLKKFSREGFSIWVVDGKYIAFAMIMRREPKRAKETLTRMQRFVIAFEKSYQKELEYFLGDMSAFDEDYVDELLEKTIGIGFLYPFSLDQDQLRGVVLSGFKSEIISYIKDKRETFLSENEGIFLEELLNYGVNELGTISRKKAITTLLDLVRDNILNPLFGNIWLPGMDEGVPETKSEEEYVEIDVTESLELPELPETSDITAAEPSEEVDLPSTPSKQGDGALMGGMLPISTETDGEEVSQSDDSLIDLSTGVDDYPGWVDYQAEQLRKMPKTQAPPRLSVDILKRETIYTGELRVIERTMKRIDATPANINKHFGVIASKGYIIDKQLENSVNGITYLLESEKDSKKVVMATVKTGDSSIVILLFDSKL